MESESQSQREPEEPQHIPPLRPLVQIPKRINRKFPDQRPDSRITREIQYKIRRILCMPFHALFIRCPARSLRKAQRLMQLGDPRHIGDGHVCDICRCQRVAGEGTHGDFYGLGSDTGHYGVGFCRHHERGKRKTNAESFARNQLRALQLYGRSLNVGEELAMVKRAVAVERQAVQEIVAASELVKSELSIVMEKLKGATTGGDEFTDKGKHGPEPISDKARAELLLKIASTISKLSVDKFKIESSDMIERDVIKQRVTEMLQLSSRYIPEEKKPDFIREFMAIWDRT